MRLTEKLTLFPLTPIEIPRHAHAPPAPAHNMIIVNDDTGKIEIELMRSYMEEKLQEKSAEWKEPVDVALTKCEVEAMSRYTPDNLNIPVHTKESGSLTTCVMLSTGEMVESGNHTCKSGAFELKICMERELFVNCPESLWKGGDKCEKSKEYLKNCPMPHPPHHGGPHHGGPPHGGPPHGGPPPGGPPPGGPPQGSGEEEGNSSETGDKTEP
ncbi:unnamed protein product [Timema podura]|uniref:Uncharacterized protein n=1 Tax=Timema podura TaxID=61482 RepID=A0ABN7PAB5_TIMPD|nr:unnamed protein product [Timema podura]